MASSSVVRSRAIAILFTQPNNVHGSVFSEKMHLLPFSLSTDSKRFFWAACTVVKDCRSQFAWPCAQLKESASCRASGNFWTTGPRGAGPATASSAAASSSGAGPGW